MGFLPFLFEFYSYGFLKFLIIKNEGQCHRLQKFFAIYIINRSNNFRSHHLKKKHILDIQGNAMLA